MFLEYKTSRQLRWFAFLFVVLMSLLVRIHHINQESLFIDELHQVSYYNYSPGDIVQLAAGQQQPPLDYWIGHYISKLSYSDFFVRLPAALFGVGSVVLVMLVVWRLTAWGYGIAIGVLMALMPFPVYFSQEARPYSIAIFFVLLVLWSLDRYLVTVKNSLLCLSVFFISVLGLLLSRTLSPLVFVLCLFGVLSLFGIVFAAKTDSVSEKKPKLIFAIIAIAAALLIYSPILINILEKGSRYASHPTQIGIQVFLKGIERFDLVPLWQAYQVQLEPLGLVLIPLIIGAPFVIRDAQKKKDLFAWIVLLLLPVSAFLHLFIFQAKTTWPFRPPYPVYILPLCLILSAISLQWLFDRIKTKGERIYLISVSVSLLLVTGVLGNTLADFKTWPKRTDWKGLANYLASTYGRNALLVFDSLVPDSGWEPTFYGFPRYYAGKSNLIPASDIPYKINALSSVKYKPVLICFYYRDYYLTRHSPYPIIPGYGEVPDFSLILKDPKMTVKQFTGFITVALQDASGNGLSDLSSLLNRFLADMKPDDQLVDLQLALAATDRKLGKDDWRQYIEDVKSAVFKKRKQEVSDKMRYIEGSQ